MSSVCEHMPQHAPGLSRGCATGTGSRRSSAADPATHCCRALPPAVHRAAQPVGAQRLCQHADVALAQVLDVASSAGVSWFAHVRRDDDLIRAGQGGQARREVDAVDRRRRARRSPAADMDADAKVQFSFGRKVRVQRCDRLLHLERTPTAVLTRGNSSISPSPRLLTRRPSRPASNSCET